MSQEQSAVESLGLVYEDILKLWVSLLEKACAAQDEEKRAILCAEGRALKKAMGIVNERMEALGVFPEDSRERK